jgi:hypothetical protein
MQLQPLASTYLAIGNVSFPPKADVIVERLPT